MELVIVPLREDENLLNWERRYYYETNIVPGNAHRRAHGLVGFSFKFDIDFIEQINEVIGVTNWHFNSSGLWVRNIECAIKLRLNLDGLVSPLH